MRLDSLMAVNSYHPARWSFLATARDYASAEVRASRAGAPATVIALLTDDEAAANAVSHAFGPSAFWAFVSRIDKSRTSLGLGDH